MKFFAILLTLFSCSSIICGCQPTSSFLTGLGTSETQMRQEHEYREEYQASRSPESIRWLINHRLQNGMSKAEIDAILGEEGEREFSDTKILDEEGLYRSDDLVYRWGPDRDGNAYLFVFRDHRLVNFENFPDDKVVGRSPRIGFSLSSDDL